MVLYTWIVALTIALARPLRSGLIFDRRIHQSRMLS